MKLLILIISSLAFSFSLSAKKISINDLKVKQDGSAVKGNKSAQKKVEIKTSMGSMTFELYHDKSKLSVENFLEYVNSGFYNGTVFHRVIPDFMIQGGGFTMKNGSLNKKNTRPPIINEAVENKLLNTRGTLAMARTNEPNSATSQFYINQKDNAFLNPSPRNPAGYAVFGKILKGEDVLDKISKVKTKTKDVPVETVTIKSITVL